MATLEQLGAALKNADAAGDADAARILAAEIAKMQPSKAYTSSVLPLSKDAQGKVSFDSNAGILGDLKRAFTLPGQVVQEAQTPRSQVSDSDVSALSAPAAMNAAAVMSPVNPMVRSGDWAVPGPKMARGKPKIPTTQALRDAADTGYKQAADIPLDVRSGAVKKLAGDIQQELEQQGFIGDFAPGTHSVLKKLQSAPDEAIATGRNLETIRQALNLAARSPDKREAAAAGIALDRLSQFRGAIPEADIVAGAPAASKSAYDAARGNYAAAMRSNKITGALDDAYTGVLDRADLRAAAANSGQNVDNSIRQRMVSLLSNRKELRGYSPEEIAAMETAAKGTLPQNLARATGNLLGGGGGLGATVTAALAGTGAAAATGNPLMMGAGVAAPIAGYGLKKVENALSRRNISKLDELIRSRSPLYDNAERPIDPGSLAKRAAFVRALMMMQNGQQQ